jgi:hypothetical protein
MSYYYGSTDSNGVISFYPDHYWAVKDKMVDGIAENTGKLHCVFKTSNVYDFSDAFPKLKKTTDEIWDAEGKKMLQSKISTITNIDFTVPDVSAFDGKRFADGGNLEDMEVVLTTQRFSTFQIVMMSIGILLIALGLWMRFTGRLK